MYEKNVERGKRWGAGVYGRKYIGKILGKDGKREKVR